jgi:type IV secretion system protein TrbC
MRHHKRQSAPTSTTLRRSKALFHVPLQALVIALCSAASVQAQSPWENAVAVLEAAFTGPIARGLSLVAIVVGGIMFAFGEGDSKRMLAGIVFGVGMAVSAVNFRVWLFP